MKLVKALLKKVEKIKSDVYRLTAESPFLAENSLPGQFLHVHAGGSVILRRPFSVHQVSGDKVSVLFRVRGKGTLALSKFREGEILDILGPLGKGFKYDENISSYGRIVFLAGGIGAAPLVFLSEEIRKLQKEQEKDRGVVILGAQTKEDILCEKEFRETGFNVMVATEDGSAGFKGTGVAMFGSMFSGEELKQLKLRVYACGPAQMFKTLFEVIAPYPGIECEASFEQVMGCGMGVCMGCAIHTKYGYRYVCKDGPVFNIREVY